jgi:chemotaxis signal transduction protein
MDEKMLAALQERSRRYGIPIATKKSDTTLGAFVGYLAGEIQIGLPSEMVHEFAPLTHWTPFRGSKFLLGITHLRGDVMGLMDLLQALTGRASGDCHWMVVIQCKGGRVAIPVHGIIGIRSVEMGELLNVDESPLSSPLVMATTRDLWFLLDEQKIQSVMESAAIAPEAG